MQERTGVTAAQGCLLSVVKRKERKVGWREREL